MHPLHDYVAARLAEKLKSRKIVVWYDSRGDFAPFRWSSFDRRSSITPAAWAAR